MCATERLTAAPTTGHHIESPPMRHLLANRPLLAALLCSFLLVLRVGEAHLHQCLDGQEAATSLHLVDVGIEHPIEAGVDHQDTNILFSTGEISKPPSPDFDIPPALLLVLLLLFAATTARVVALRGLSSGLFRTVSWLRPPLRGPPLTALS